MRPERKVKRHGAVATRLGVVLGTVFAWHAAHGADPLHGRNLYMAHCKSCHGASGVSQIPGGPDFSRGERLLVPDNVLVASIKRGKGMMPAYQGRLTDNEILDIIAFVRTLR